MAFLKEFLRVTLEPLKIDDYGDIKNHVTALYNAKKLAKQQTKSSAAASSKGADWCLSLSARNASIIKASASQIHSSTHLFFFFKIFFSRIQWCHKRKPARSTRTTRSAPRAQAAVPAAANYTPTTPTRSTLCEGRARRSSSETSAFRCSNVQGRSPRSWGEPSTSRGQVPRHGSARAVARAPRG